MQTSGHGPVETQVRAAIDTETVLPHAAGAVALALTYAALIDDAAPAAKYAKAIAWLSRLRLDDEDDAAAGHVDTIRVALAAHSVASDLGPKLLAALDALLLTPRARDAAKKAVTDAKPASPLDQLAAARARKGRAETLDPAAP